MKTINLYIEGQTVTGSLQLDRVTTNHTTIVGGNIAEQELINIAVASLLDDKNTDAKKALLSAIKNEIKKCYDEACDWCNSGYGRYAPIMIDCDDGDIWVDIFHDCNHWVEYHSDTITALSDMGWVRIDDYSDDAIYNAYVKDAVHNLKQYGWEIIDDETN